MPRKNARPAAKKARAKLLQRMKAPKRKIQYMRPDNIGGMADLAMTIGVAAAFGVPAHMLGKCR